MIIISAMGRNHLMPIESGVTHTLCGNAYPIDTAEGSADCPICLAVVSELISWESLQIAKREGTRGHPKRKVFTGPELVFDQDTEAAVLG